MAMSSGGSVSQWIEDIKRGDRDAAQSLWERYFARLAAVARNEMAARHRRVSDEEDVALSAFHKFCVAAENGRLPDLSDRDGLWRLLVKMTARKAIDQKRRQLRQKRGGGAVRGESALQAPGIDEPHAMGQVIGDRPSPELMAMMSEEIQRLLELIDDPDLQNLAVAKMEGYTNKEIAEQMKCSERTVERRLKLIRAKCNEEFLD